MAVNQLGRIAYGFTGDGLDTHVVDLMGGFRRQNNAEAQIGEECMPERIVLVHIQDSGNTDDTARCIVRIQ